MVVGIKMTTLKLKTKKLVDKETIDLINLRREQHLKAFIERPLHMDNDGNKIKPSRMMAKLCAQLANDFLITENAFQFYEYLSEAGEWIRCNKRIFIGGGQRIRRNPTEEQILKFGLRGYGKND